MLRVNEAELAELEKRLNAVADTIAKKALRSAARKAMNEVRKEARENAPEETGLLYKNFGLLTRAKDGEVSAKIGIRRGAKENDSTPFYFRFLEFGTKDMQARPFLRPALARWRQRIIDAIHDAIKRAL